MFELFVVSVALIARSVHKWPVDDNL